MAEEKVKSKNEYCKNIFRAGEDKISRDNFTQKWIQIINSQERDKTLSVNQ